METLGFHPLANLFPLIEGEEFDALVGDIKENGQRDKIVIFEGLILDGRNRYRACAVAGRDAELEFFTGTYAEALAYVISKNLRRRQLSESQRSMIAARLSNLKPGRPAETPSIEGVSVETAAKMMNVGKASVERAKEVLRADAPELVEAVDRGQIAVSVAAQAKRLTKEQQRQVVDEAIAGRANVVRTIVKRAARTAREAELGQKQRELPDRKYGVILADPEWEFVVFSKVTGLDRAADNHYPTSTEKQIAARDVQKIAAKDCLLLLWVTDLARGIRVMESWGFEYKSYFVWVKDFEEVEPDAHGKRVVIERGPAGTGYWNRDRDEILLVGTRGQVPCPSMGTQGESVIFAARPHQEKADRGKHSAKPTYFHEWVEKHYPTLPKIELNARAARPGWDCWGNEAPEQIDLPPHDPETGEVIDTLPAAHPERSRLLPDRERINALADANGMVRVDDTHVVAKDFVTSGEIAQAEAYAVANRKGAVLQADESIEPLAVSAVDTTFRDALDHINREVRNAFGAGRAPEPEIPAFLIRKPTPGASD